MLILLFAIAAAVMLFGFLGLLCIDASAKTGRPHSDREQLRFLRRYGRKKQQTQM